MVWEGYVVDRSESTARSVWKSPGQRETRRLNTVGRLGTGSAADWAWAVLSVRWERITRG